MGLISAFSDTPPSGALRGRRYGATTAAVAATAAAGAVAVDTDNAWYRALRKPDWQPPSWAFGTVWTPLYATIAYAAGHTLGKIEDPRRRTGFVSSLAVNLSLNAAWTWLFFTRRDPVAALVGTVLLDLSNADLLRRTARVDPVAARTLVPYAAWCCFATALNASIVRRNPRRRL
ncbi:TspO/MBR family protein [Streptomyces sp. NPDC060205]|uniref:TspO/MBR family protein n=1 Tax=Streptomyces sp. NPDC060205 TaxID=3347072 RepID=UPI003659E5AA